MEQLIFFAVIIFFSIIESIARSRKRKQGGGRIEDDSMERSGSEEWESEWAQESAADLPTYDEEPSYDDEATRSGTQPPPAPRGVAQGEPSSRTMLPGGLLEELAGIAGKLEAERQRMERAEADVRSEEERAESVEQQPVRAQQQKRWEELQQRREARAREREERAKAIEIRRAKSPLSRGPARPRPSHRVHRAHAEFGTDPSERTRSEQDGLDPLARTLSADAKAVRGQLLSDSASALRQAIILQEVLGPPKAMQEDPV
ncbi:MAG: hypothetical protein ACPHO4_11735 [Longimicrobiales bacterium]